MLKNLHKNIFNIKEFKQILKTYDLKATSQRIAVHEAMITLGHASADMVYEFITKNNPNAKITVASIYNVLTQLALYGIYQYRLSANSKMYFDVNKTKHIHLYDIDNNHYIDINDNELINLVESHIDKRRYSGYKVYGVDINILCHPRKKTAKVIENKM